MGKTKKPVKIVVAGAGGKMGSRIIALASGTPEFEIVGAIEADRHPLVGTRPFSSGPLIVSDNDLIGVEEIFKNADVLIDFTNPESAIGNVAISANRGKAMVIGTTGLKKEYLEVVNTASKTIPIVLASNMSVGVNLLLGVLSDIAEVTGDDYDVEIIEAHHRMKKDAPSGTAMRMAEVIASALHRNLEETAVYARHGMIGERKPKEIGIQTIRGGDIVGEHTVMFCGLGERIEITHRVSSRDTFAKGALKAALWVAKEKKGLYDMTDVLFGKAHV